MNTPTKNERPDDQQRHSWSIRVAKVSGIPIRLHFTFLLLLAFIGIQGWGRGGLAQVGFLLGVFTCVALHELGHSIVAQRLGYPVYDIVLYPIGGVASIDRTPRARHELLIAVAGPAVNVVIACLLALVINLFTQDSLAERIQNFVAQVEAGQGAVPGGGYLTLLFWSNVMLVLFNMIPAFPMDGGRVLRAALALKIGRAKATRIAAGIGQILAVFFVLIGLGVVVTGGKILLGQPIPMLVIIGFFVYFGAGQERTAEEAQGVMEDAPVGDAMMREFATLAHGDTLKHASDVLLAGSQQDFPVVAGGEVVGILSRSQLLRGLAREGDSAYVATFMDRDVVFASPDEPLEDYLLASHTLRRAPVLVRENEGGELIGMLTLENAMEFLTLRQIARLRDDKE